MVIKLASTFALTAVMLLAQALQPERFVKVSNKIVQLRASDTTHVVAILGEKSAISWDAAGGRTQFLSSEPLTTFKPLDPVSLNFRSPFIFQAGGASMRMIVKPEREQVLIVENGRPPKWLSVPGDAAVQAYFSKLQLPRKDPRDTKTQVALMKVGSVAVDGTSFYALYSVRFKDNTTAIGRFAKVNGVWKRSMLRAHLPEGMGLPLHVAARQGRFWLASDKMIASYRED